MTAATQPSIEDLVLGAIPWIPKVNFHNPVLAYENGDEFVRHFPSTPRKASSTPFILVVEGSIPDETNKAEGYWASFGTDQQTGQPILTCEWIDRLAPKAWAVVAAGTCADLRRHSCDGGQSDRLHGACRLPGLGVEIEGRHSDRVRSGLSGAARQFHGDAALPAVHRRRDARR